MNINSEEKLTKLIEEHSELIHAKNVYQEVRDEFQITGKEFLNEHTIEFIQKLVMDEIKEKIREKKYVFDKRMEKLEI